MKSYFDCIIIGAGVAGMTASIYLKRAEVECLLLEQSAPGGQMVKSSIIENYPGFEKIDGAGLAMKMFEQVTNLGVDYRYGNVTDITVQDDCYRVVTDQQEYTCKYLILATGRSPRTLGLPKEEKLIGRGISFCATCDGSLYRGKTVGVIGGGNSSLEETAYLSEICKKVYLINRSDTLRGDPILQERLTKENIDILYNSVVETLIEKDGHFSGVILKGEKTLDLDGLFIYIGQIPNTESFKNLNLTLDQGYIVVDRNMKTNLPRVYACGDIIKKDYYQIATAVGEGTVAALAIKNDHHKR